VIGDFDLFSLYRSLLGIFVSIYVVVHLIQSIWRWGFRPFEHRWANVMRRYVILLLLKTPTRRFALELLQIGGLMVILVWLISYHHRWAG